VLSVLKASNEPLLSNKWTFHRTSELVALDWATSHLVDADIGTEYDERLAVGFQMTRGMSPGGNSIGQFDVEDQRNFLVTSITRLRGARIGAPLPNPPDALQVYDNGDAQFYHLRPLTPFQK
jgi:hypothetical protein